MTKHIKDGGVWKRAKDYFVRDGGVWKEVKTGEIKDGGVWKPFHQKLITRYGPFSNTNRLQTTNDLPAFHPITFACWASAYAECDVAWGIGQTANDQYRHYVSGYTGYMHAQTRDGSSNSTALQTIAYPQDSSWFHVAGVFNNTSDRRILYNGGNKITNTASRDPGTTRARMCIGTNAAATYPWDDGYICHAAIWTTALSDSEIADLANGALPSEVNAANLHSYLPMTGPDPAYVEAGNGSSTWSVNGTIPSTPNVLGPI